jgi:hypothetical protein
MKLDIGCGQNLEKDWVGLDIAKIEGVIQHDCFKFPWPIESDSVEEAKMVHFFEHVPQDIRFQFMDELYRIMKVGAKCTVVCPYYSSMRAIQDPTHMFPPICEASFLYFNKDWRKQNKLDHYRVNCDFDFGYGYSLPSEWSTRADEPRNFAIAHYMNTAQDLQVVLTKRDPAPK